MIDTNSPLYCPPTIRPNAKIAFVGEAPGQKECYHKEGFIGPAGKVLRELCSAVGINFSDCHITNTIKYLPENIDKLISSPLLKEHEEVLREELSATKANLIIALGNVSLYALTRQNGITKRRGSIYESTLLPGRKVLACLHPSSCLYDGKYTNRHLISFDLVKAKEECEFPEIKTKNRIIHTNPKFEEVIDWLKFILSQPQDFETSFDTEFVQGILNCFGFSISPVETMCIPLAKYGEQIFSPNEERSILQLTAKILDSHKIKKIMQNSIFDVGSMFSHYGMPANNVEDTMIGQAILAPDLQKDLGFLTSIYTDMPYFKDQSSKMWKGIGGDWETFWNYNGKDTLAAHESWHCIKSDLIAQGNFEIYQNQNSLVLPLIYMSERGYLIDAVGLKQASIDAAIKLAGPAGEYLQLLGKSIVHKELLWAEKQGYPIGGLWNKLWSICRDRINPSSPAQLKQYFYITKNISAYTNRVKSSSGGYESKITVDALALKRLARKGYEEASIIQDIRFISKRKSTYYDVKLSDSDRFRTSYNPVGGGGDRLSSSKRELDDEGTNAQNQPKEMKKFFIADPGMILINIDIKQADNRVFAHICPEPTMIEAFESGIDVHSLTAVGIFNQPIEEIISEHKAGITCDIGDGTKTKRFWAKKANHSFNYGEGADKFSLSMEIPLEEAKRIRDGYLRMYPGIQNGWRWIQGELNRTRMLVNCYGRKRIFLGEMNNNTFNSAYSFIPRSTVVDTINRRAINYVYYNNEFKAFELLGQVHDSSTFQAPITIDIIEFYRLINLIINSIEQPISWKDSKFILPAEISIGYNLYDQTEIDIKDKDKSISQIETILLERR